MRAQRTASDAAQQAVVEQQALSHVGQALRVAMAWRADDVAIERKINSVQFMARSLERHLERLLMIEEEGGYLVEVAEGKPQLYNQVMTLERDHDRFRETLSKLMPQVARLEHDDAEGLERICVQLDRLLRDLHQHEHRETALLQEAVLRDEGGLE
jgi:hemerythrin-like domain-containing protein